MQKDGDLLLNVSCSHLQNNKDGGRKLPARMPDGSRIENNRNLVKKIFKTHHAATSSGTVFIPKHKLPVLDEFGLMPDAKGLRYEDLQQQQQQHHQLKKAAATDDKTAPSVPLTKGEKRRKRKKKDDEPKIIPKEVQLVAGGLPPSFPKHRIKKFTEEYQEKKRRLAEEGADDDGEPVKKRRSFVPGLNPRKREKSASLFTDVRLEDLEDVHPFLVQNVAQNYEIDRLTKIQSLVMPHLLKTRFDSKRHDFLINSGVGTGKILSYVLPIVNNLALLEPKINRTEGIHALVLLPTRELATDVNNMFVKLCRSFAWIVPGLLIGGERKKSEKARLRKGLNILITTPGRLIDHLEHSMNMDFAKMRYCVLADVHRLLDPERAEVSKKIAILLRKRLPHNCVRCVVTSTMTKKLEKFCEIVVDKPQVFDAFKQFE